VGHVVCWGRERVGVAGLIRGEGECMRVLRMGGGVVCGALCKTHHVINAGSERLTSLVVAWSWGART